MIIHNYRQARHAAAPSLSTMLQQLQRMCPGAWLSTSSAAISADHQAAQNAQSPQQQQQQQQQPLQQQYQQLQEHQQQGGHHLQQALSALHTQFLYSIPSSQQVPQLPRFIPRRQSVPLPVLEALQLVQSHASAGFPETVETHIRLKVDPRRGDQMVRGAAVLPYSLGKPQRIAVFAEGQDADDALAAGADVVGSDDLVAQILDGKGKGLDFTACLATPDLMPKLVKLGRILGPRGLMPNPKLGTLTTDLPKAISELRQGRVEFKMDRTAIVHAPIGKVTFSTQQLHANIGALTAALLAAKPEVIRGGLPKFVRSVSVCSTMGRSVPVEVSSLLKAMQVAEEGLRPAAA